MGLPNIELIDAKLNRVIGPMIEDLKRSRRVDPRVGGTTVRSFGKEIEFQEARRANLEWAKSATDDEIQQEISNLEASISADELACKYGSGRALSIEAFEIVAKIEDLEIALGTHPGVQSSGVK